MNTKKELKNYLKPSGISKVLIVIFSVLCALCLALSVLSNKKEIVDPVEFDSYLPAGTYCYIDVIGVDDYVFIHNNAQYHTAIDANYEYANIVISESQFKKMRVQYEYYISDDSDLQPQIIRLKGFTENADNYTIDEFISYYSNDLATKDDYYNYFGKVVLDTTSTIENDTPYMWLTFAFLIGLFDLLVIIIRAMKKSQIKKSIKRLSEFEMAEALQQIQSSDDTNRKLLLTSDYAVSKDAGFVAKYSDILWAYKKVTTTNFFFKQYALVLRLTDKSEINIPLKDTGVIYDSIFQALRERNSSILIGYSDDNRKKYKEISLFLR